jgi:hypothetical protein
MADSFMGAGVDAAPVLPKRARERIAERSNPQRSDDGVVAGAVEQNWAMQQSSVKSRKQARRTLRAVYSGDQVSASRGTELGIIVLGDGCHMERWLCVQHLGVPDLKAFYVCCKRNGPEKSTNPH